MSCGSGCGLDFWSHSFQPVEKNGGDDETLNSRPLLALGTVVTCDTAARVACRFEVKGLVKSVQAYCRFAIAIIATMQAHI